MKSLLIKNIEQIGAERVCKITITGVDETKKSMTFYLFIELYAKGNVILTDSELKAMALLRQHTYNENAKCQQNEVYPVHEAAKIFADQIELSNYSITADMISPKLTNSSLVSKLVPCVHQALSDVYLLKNQLKPADKVDLKNSEKLIQTSKQMLELYKTEIPQGGYLYYHQDKQFSFELSPVKLDFVN